MTIQVISVELSVNSYHFGIDVFDCKQLMLMYL